MIKIVSAATVATLLLMAGAHKSHAAAFGATPPACPGGALAVNEARVYTQTGYGGNCYSLVLGSDGWGDPYTSWEASFGFPNDIIRSAKIGSGVTLVLFWNSYYTQDNGSPLLLLPGNSYTTLGTWNGQASAARVQSFTANACTGASGDILAVFTGTNFSGDCNEIPVGTRCYQGAFEMGFRNDTLSSLINMSASYSPQLYPSATWAGVPFNISPGASYTGVGSFNDVASSLSGDATWTTACHRQVGQ